ncbi:hypothetical protein [Candidatus Halobonum tyrrellensis]|uniref:Uncharacterized protein n=1 Tax=Candidatus Halobonum tyrrellensis G22 TaxID=1324957 RepID=V4H939_9EURY|nr:hypothetical protein [Candidatus Halobonum tyrrellensis]ESP87230.1 hypothetical protein K933_15234 [Candidatus Halobonum tyrrellensis G22]
MNVTGALVRLGSLGCALAFVGALAALLSSVAAGAAGVPAVGLLLTLGLLVVGVAAAVAWGRRTARARWETPYW